MTAEQAQQLAPSYLRLPNDGALFRCNDCKQEYSFSHVVIPFTPDGKQHELTCLNCIDTDWFANAKHCGVITSK